MTQELLPRFIYTKIPGKMTVRKDESYELLYRMTANKRVK
jgi:hypothetical protein